jgi:predicted RNA-binding protein YlxR (DUF448 family)
VNERSCVVCRTRRPASELLPVHRQGDRIALGRALRGRGSWVCPECVARVRESRFGRGSGLDVEALRVVLLEGAAEAFDRARGAGVIASGRFDVERSAQCAFVLVTRDAGAYARRALPSGVPVVRLPWSTVETGRMLGRGPRSVLAVQRSVVAADLLERLRLLAGLG